MMVVGDDSGNLRLYNINELTNRKSKSCDDIMRPSRVHLLQTSSAHVLVIFNERMIFFLLLNRISFKSCFFLNSGFRMAGDCWRTHETVLSERGRNLCLMLFFCVNNLSVVILMNDIPSILFKYIYGKIYRKKEWIVGTVICLYMYILLYLRTCK